MTSAGTPSPAVTIPRQDRYAASTTLRGAWLLAAWLGGGLVVVLAIVGFLDTIPILYAILVQDPFGLANVLDQFGVSIGDYATCMLALTFVVLAINSIVAVVIVWHRPSDRMALHTALFLVLFGLGLPFQSVFRFTQTQAWGQPTMFLVAATAVCLFPFFYLFPDSRFVPGWTRRLAVVWLIWTPMWVIWPATPLNPYTWSPLLIVSMQAISFGSACVAQVIRYVQHSGPEQRQQTKWVLFGSVTTTLLFVPYAIAVELNRLVGPAAWAQLTLIATTTLVLLGVLVVPLSFAVAVLRYRLWDVDVVINRTLVYGLLTSSLVLVYAGSVFVLQQLVLRLTGQRADWVVAISTLAIVLLFQPLRERVQAGVDRRFFRGRYDAARTVAAFGASARDEVDIDHLAAELRRVVDATVQPTWFSAWFRPVIDDVGVANTHDGPTPIDFIPDAELVSYFLAHPTGTDVEHLPRVSATTTALLNAHTALVVPLVSQGDVVGLLALGPQHGDHAYSVDDRSLLNTLATQAAPAVRVAQLVRRQQAEVLARDRLEHELRQARQLSDEISAQLSLQPDQLPRLPGWEVAVAYRPARVVGGDFFDLLVLDDGRLMIVVGDAAGKGVTAALFMANTRSILRGAARRLVTPGAVLARANEILCVDKPRGMFSTCFCGLLEPSTGHLRFANAGHDLPLHHGATSVTELQAAGMPLGLLPNSRYAEGETILEPGDTLLFASDGVAEAHDPSGAMFGVHRLASLFGEHGGGSTLVDAVLDELHAFVGPAWVQEDDLTLVMLQRLHERSTPSDAATDNNELILAEFSVMSLASSERRVLDQVSAAITPLAWSETDRERVQTAVGEATMNAIEHGNDFRPDLPVDINVRVKGADLVVQITDYGGEPSTAVPATPDLDAKLRGRQSPRGWGVFLIHHMVDDVSETQDGARHTIELVFRRSDVEP